jgi:hypothetical protein
VSTTRGKRATEPRPYARTGLHTLKAKLKLRGLNSIDRRSAGARELFGWRSELVADLGGEAELSAAKRTLVDAAARTWLYVGCVDAYLLEQRSLVNLRRRSLLPVVRERQALVDSLARILGQLGLERQARKVPDLSAYLRDRYKDEAPSSPPPSAPPPSSSPTPPTEEASAWKM